MAKKTAVVGEDYALPGPCLVAHPDGTVVTSNVTYRFAEPGKYRVIPNADPDNADEVTVRAPKED